MIKEARTMRVECPACGCRLMDKEEDATGKIQVKCTKSKHVWQVDLSTNKFKLISGKPISGLVGFTKLDA